MSVLMEMLVRLSALNVCATECLIAKGKFEVPPEREGQG